MRSPWIDPASVMGRAMLQIGAVFAEMERNLLRERTCAGLAAARARGRLGGRRPHLSADKLDTARRLLADPMLSMAEVAARVGVGRTTLYRALDRATVAPAGNGAEQAKAGHQRRTSGRKPRLSAEGLDTARRLMADPLLTMEEIATRLGVGRTTL